MSVLAGSLVIQAYYLSGLVSPDFQSVTSPQIERGIYYLNDVLAEQTLTPSLVPYYKPYNFNLIINQKDYLVPNLLIAETFTFLNGNVRYSMEEHKRKKFFGEARIESVSGYPYCWEQERTVGGSNVSIYWLPSQPFLSIIYGKFGAAEVTESTNLSTIYDRYYLVYLQYCLANSICAHQHIAALPEITAKIEEMEKSLRNVSTPDFSMKHMSIVPSKDYYNYADADLGLGWDASATAG